MKQDHFRLSKFLSYVLRHKPEAIGLHLDENGWALVDELIQCAKKDGKQLSYESIATIVRTNDKQRFSLSSDGSRIRANQGHSIEIDLALEPLEPPKKLYHGTAKKFLASILADGLQAKSRHHVHLSKDTETALKVGQRHGKAVILEIDTQGMSQAGFVFYRSDNGVWLTDHVPSRYFIVKEE